MREARTRDIDGLAFKIVQLPAIKATLLLHRLGRAVGPALLRAWSGVDLSDGLSSLTESDVSLTGVADALERLFDRFSERDLEALIREVFEGATVAEVGSNAEQFLFQGGSSIGFDSVLAGRPGTVIKAIQFALEANYGNFSVALLGALGARKASSSKASVT